MRPLAALVAGHSISSLGSLMAAVALPWFVLETTGSPGRMALVLAAESAPLLLVGPASARLARRLGARGTLLVCDAVWAPAAALIPLLHHLGALTFPLLLGCAFLLGVPWAASAGAGQAIVPELVDEDLGRVAQANAVLRTADRLAYFAGPALGGALVPFLGAANVLLLDAATFCLSFALVAAFVPAVRAAPEAAAGGGWSVIRGDRLLRALTGASALSQAAFMGMTAAIPALAYDAYDRSPEAAGLLLGIWGGGAMAGGMAAYRLAGTHDPRRLGALGWALQAAPLWLLVAAPPTWAAAAALAVSGVANGVRVPPIAALTASRVPAARRAETLTLASSLVLGAGFLALLAAGPALALAGVTALWAAVAAVQTLAAALFARAVSRR